MKELMVKEGEFGFYVVEKEVKANGKEVYKVLIDGLDESNANKFVRLFDIVQPGMDVLAIEDTSYGGLKGVITEVKYGKDKETENTTLFDIYVDFEEPDYGCLDQLYPHLNGTSIEQVIMGEDELAFFTDPDTLPVTMEGLAVCETCYKPLDYVTETQYEDISWTFVNGSYVKNTHPGGSEGIKCPYCDARIEEPEQHFKY